jgi:hypothetical protein
MSLYNDISPQTLTLIGITLGLVFIVMFFRICCDIRLLRKARKDQAERVRGLLLSNMLERLNIPLKDYFKKTSDMDNERHIWACEHCPEPDDCEHMFLGENIDPETFCPNYDQLKSLKGADAKQANSQ